MFRDILASLLTRVDGAKWAMVVGLDGVVLEAAPPKQPEQADRVAAEYAAVVRASQRAVHSTEGGEMRSFVLVTKLGKLVFQQLTSEYFLLMGLSPAGHSGRARFEIGRSRDQLERELVF